MPNSLFWRHASVCRISIRSHVICGAQEGIEGSIKARFDGIAPVTMLSELRREVNPFADIRAIGALRQILRALQPSLVHSHSSKAGILARQAAAQERLPSVHSIHGWGHTSSDRWAKRAAYIALERRAARQSKALVAVSEDVRDEGLRDRIGSPEQYRVIPECVSYRRSSLDFPEARARARRSLGLASDQPLVGWVGRFVPQKDPDTLASALIQVLGAAPDAVAVLVGDGPLRGRVRGQIDRAGLSRRTVWTGLRPDARALYPAFDVLLHVSRWEGQPRVVQEALVERVPVVATRASGVQGLIDDGSTGYIVPPGDAQSAAARTLSVLDGSIPSPLPDTRLAPLLARHGLAVALRGHRDLYLEVLRGERIE